MTLAVTSKSKKTGSSGKTKTRLEPVRDAERTQQMIMAAAEIEFANKGLAGARVDVIADQAGANKRMLYYYFGSKEELYLAVLERAYIAMRKTERELNLTDLEPLDAIKRLVEFKFDYCQAHPLMIPLLSGENMLGAKYLKQSRKLRDMNLSLVEVIRKVLAAGVAKRVIRPGIDPLHLYLSMSAESYFYFSNAATLSATFGRPLLSESEQKMRRKHCVDVILAFVRAK
jgi:TetR/AcrR family transcriptional regulator